MAQVRVKFALLRCKSCRGIIITVTESHDLYRTDIANTQSIAVQRLVGGRLHLCMCCYYPTMESFQRMAFTRKFTKLVRQRGTNDTIAFDKWLTTEQNAHDDCAEYDIANEYMMRAIFEWIPIMLWETKKVK